MPAAIVSTRPIQVIGIDMFAEQPLLPSGEVYLLMRVLHDWDNEHCCILLMRILAAAPANAVLIVVDRLRRDDAILGLMTLNMMLATGGKERTAAEMEALLTVSGWYIERTIALETPPHHHAIIVKPKARK